MSEKIYSDDPIVPYKTTKINSSYSRMEIDAVLAKWGIRKSTWNWEPEINRIYIEFQYEELIDGVRVSPWIRVEAPVIWDSKTRNKAEAVHWNISLRVMYWFIKSHLEAAYLWQSNKTTAFLPYIATGKEIHQTLAKKMLREIEKLPALEGSVQVDTEKIVDV